MNGYSKIKNLHLSSESSSYCLISSSPIKDKCNQQPEESKTLEPHTKLDNADAYIENGPNCGAPKFRRNASVTSSSSSSAVKRVFSIKRSMSVSERYCRINDQDVVLSSNPDHDDDDETDQPFKDKKGGRKGILRSFKRIFRL
ncbi:hypothetical protein STAS_33171 [Striga asiatica]|uniref:Uncharacterized protein n=1 Tax=Striga asiatica TaxID=4170 RepID=A0A5A7RCP0_STRAF|nr:hypothetical protein STAS_33171 [Striga asiatica]